VTYVLDQNFTRRAKGKGSAIFFHLARPGLTPTAGCVAIAPSAMRKLAPRLARGCAMEIGPACGRPLSGRAAPDRPWRRRSP